MHHTSDWQKHSNLWLSFTGVTLQHMVNPISFLSYGPDRRGKRSHYAQGTHLSTPAGGGVILVKRLPREGLWTWVYNGVKTRRPLDKGITRLFQEGNLMSLLGEGSRDKSI
eukprot:1138350-Pelagomonas_calceolata.AAC.2